jgi:hypothetical protein
VLGVRAFQMASTVPPHADVIEELELSGELRALQSGAAQIH